MSEEKVFCYITRAVEEEKQVLAYYVPGDRKAGVQVPNTDLNEGEEGKDVAIACAAASSGLNNLELVRPLGNTYFYNLDDDISYKRFFFHFTSDETRDEWEMMAGDVKLVFHWVPVLKATKKIYWDQAKFLKRTL